MLKHRKTRILITILLIATIWFLGCASDNKKQEAKEEVERAEEKVRPGNFQIQEAEPDPAIDIKLIKIPSGTFMMGSDKFPNEKPIHKVEIKEDFYIGKYEVTQEQWQNIMGDNPSYFKGEPNLPVEEVSWIDVGKFLDALNKKSGKYTYRLPSEAEWEYAARATSTEDYAGNLDLMAWYGANSERKTHPVGQKQPNAFGLYDMHGNVYEWCQDSWHPNYQGAPSNSSAWEDTPNNSPDDLRVFRGGSWYYSAINNRSSYRLNAKTSAYDNGVGLRVVAVLRSNIK